MKRITRFSVEKISFRNSKTHPQILSKFVWTRGTELLKTIYKNDFFKGIRKSYKFEDFKECVELCRENSNVQSDLDNDIAIVIRRWSYHKRG